jgi:WD40 repeat protein
MCDSVKGLSLAEIIGSTPLKTVKKEGIYKFKDVMYAPDIDLYNSDVKIVNYQLSHNNKTLLVVHTNSMLDVMTQNENNEWISQLKRSVLDHFNCRMPFTQNDRMFAVYSGGQIYLYDTKEIIVKNTIDLDSRAVDMNFSEDGKNLAVITKLGTIEVHKIENNEIKSVIKKYYSQKYNVCFSGKNIFFSGMTNVFLWDYKNNKNPVSIIEEEHQQIREFVIFNEKILLHYDYTAKVYSKSGRLSNSVNVMENLDGIANIKNINKDQVAIIDFDGKVFVWTICEWNDRNHHLFSREKKKLVFHMMCIKQKINILPIELWLEIFKYI